MSDHALLGPQYRIPNLRACLDGLKASGPLVAITAGWQEREGEIEELRAHVGGAVADLGLYARGEQAFADDAPLAAAHHERQLLLQEMQEYYRLRLAALMQVVEELEALPGDSPPLRRARRAALGDVRRLDREHLAAVMREQHSFAQRWQPPRRAAVAAHAAVLAAAIERAAAVLVAGGHVAVLLNRMRLFGLGEPLARRPLVAWSAGAMALTERVVLFHDRPPQGAAHPEVLDAGLAIVTGVVALPHAAARLTLNDPARVRSFARRFAPAQCLALDHGSLARWHRRRLVASSDLRRLTRAGRVVGQSA